MPETFTSATNGPDDDAPFRSRLTFDPRYSPSMGGYYTGKLSAQVLTDRWRAAVFVSNPWNSSSDTFASLPSNYTFTGGNAGVHTFTATLKTAGTQSITATDTETASTASASTAMAQPTIT